MKKLLLLASLLASLSCASKPYATELACPDKLEISESATLPEGNWSAVKDEGRRGHFLESVSIYAGHPSQLATLVPDKTKSLTGQRKYIWNLPEAGASGYWLACSYAHTLLILTRALPNEIRRCELTESRLPSGVRLGIVGFACQ